MQDINNNDSLFDDAYEQLLFMVKEIEKDNVSLHDLSTKITGAQALLKKCEAELRKAETAVDDASTHPEEE